MLYTLPKLANDMGFSYQTLRRWITTGRIPGVTAPTKGRWSYLTQTEVDAIADFVTARTGVVIESRRDKPTG